MESYSLIYYHPEALLVLNKEGKLRVLFTPFRVLCMIALTSIPANTWVYVEKVCSNKKDQLQYVIFNEHYSYRHFKIPMMF
jgi:hypothetical protein